MRVRFDELPKQETTPRPMSLPYFCYRYSRRIPQFLWKFLFAKGGRGSCAWHRKERWDAYYLEMFEGENDSVSQKIATTRISDHLGTELERYQAWNMQSVLVTGCGVALTSFALKEWGYHVTAIDISQKAIDYQRAREVDEEQLIDAMQVWEPCEDRGSYWTFSLSKDLESKQRAFLSRTRKGGSLRFLQGDWLNQQLPPQDLIFAECNFGGAGESFVRNSLRAFCRCLAPGGLLFCVNWNCLHLDIDAWIIEEGFQLLDIAGRGVLGPVEAKVPSKKYGANIMRTG